MNPLLLSALFVGQCPGGQCSPAVASVVASPRSGWHAEGDSLYYLWLDGRVVAAWNADTGAFTPRAASGEWIKPRLAGERTYAQFVEPAPPAPIEMADPPKPKNNGFDRSSLSTTERASVSGVEVSPALVQSIITGTRGDSKIPRDCEKLRLTVIGTPAEQHQVLSDVRASPLHDRYVVQAYAPDHWSVQGMGYAPGTPSIYLQRPDGGVLLRQANYTGGLAALVAAVRKADPTYDPAKDSPPGGGFSWPLIPALPAESGWLVVGGLILLWTFGRQIKDRLSAAWSGLIQAAIAPHVEELKKRKDGE